MKPWEQFLEDTTQHVFQVAEAVGCGTVLVQVPQGNPSASRRSCLSWLKSGQKKQQQVDKCQDCVINHLIICSFFPLQQRTGEINSMYASHEGMSYFSW